MTTQLSLAMVDKQPYKRIKTALNLQFGQECGWQKGNKEATHPQN